MFNYDSRDEKIKRFDRQIRAIGSDLMRNVCEMTVMIIGLEGVKKYLFRLGTRLPQYLFFKELFALDVSQLKGKLEGGKDCAVGTVSYARVATDLSGAVWASVRKDAWSEQSIIREYTLKRADLIQSLSIHIKN